MPDSEEEQSNKGSAAAPIKEHPKPVAFDGTLYWHSHHQSEVKPKAPTSEQPAGGFELRLQHGSTVHYDAGAHFPSSVSFLDRSQYKFEYDGQQNLLAITDRADQRFVRPVNGANFVGADGGERSWSLQILPDGTISQRLKDGRAFLFAPDGNSCQLFFFRQNFPFQAVYEALVRKDDANQDKTLTQTELIRANAQPVSNSDEKLLLQALTTCYDQIITSRIDAYAISAGGMIYDDVRAFDAQQKKIRLRLSEPPKQLMEHLTDAKEFANTYQRLVKEILPDNADIWIGQIHGTFKLDG